MRTWILAAVGGGLLFFTALAVLFFFGYWIPNDPSPTQYPVRGIDVSAHQGRIDWKRVAAGGIRFVYLKATEGGDFQDASFHPNLQAARAAGLACGAYHFYSLKIPGADQAQNYIHAVPPASMNLPPALDLEFWGNSSARPSPEAFKTELRTYLHLIAAAYGREPVIYTSADFMDVYLKDFRIEQFWVRDILLKPKWDGTGAWLFWQFSERGEVPGIDGFVDLDVYNGRADRFNELARNVAVPQGK
jgi:lysozyme